MEPDYSFYKEDDFLHDDRFLAWMLGEDPQAAAFWEHWIRRHPEQVKTIRRAMERYRLLTSFDKVKAREEDRRETWSRISRQIEALSEEKKRHFIHSRRWWLAAAVLLLIAGSAVWILRQQPRNPLQVIAAGAQLRKITLPDSTVILLNKQARITYAADQAREIWLEGEAYFKVKKIRSSSGNRIPFKVRAGPLQVIVLGTSFSVSRDTGSVAVVLSEGSVKALALHRDYLMKPGERLQLSGNTVTKEKVDPQLYMAWKDGEFRFRNTSLQELARLVKDRYGYELVIRGNTGLHITHISGTVSAENEETFWKTLSVLLNAKVEKKQNQVILIPQ